MASSKTAEREARAARDRLRRYNARQAVHLHQTKRRRRDNVVSIVGAVVIVALAALTQVLYFTAGPGVPAPAPKPTPSAHPGAQGANVGDVPNPALAEARTWTGSLVLNDVTLGIDLDGAAAPQAVAAFVQGVNNGYFVDKACHRLTDNGFFVMQCGSIDGHGTADPSFMFGPIENAPADNFYPAGTIAMARAGDAYTNGRQFFIVYEDTTIPADAAGGYTVFGKVTSGLDSFIEKIASRGIISGDRGPHDGAPVMPTTITQVSIN